MNERIIELAEKAGFVYNFDPVNWLKYEKFAELIVRECMCIADDMKALDVAAELERYFGVNNNAK